MSIIQEQYHKLTITTTSVSRGLKSSVNEATIARKGDSRLNFEQDLSDCSEFTVLDIKRKMSLYLEGKKHHNTIAIVEFCMKSPGGWLTNALSG